MRNPRGAWIARRAAAGTTRSFANATGMGFMDRSAPAIRLPHAHDHVYSPSTI
jgi:hypothetical protein